MWVTEEALSYLPILIMMAIGLAVGVILITVNLVLGSKDTLGIAQKFDVYECGVPASGNARQQFSVRYYVVGIVFLLFDVEVVFLYPWAVTYRKFISQGSFNLFEMIVFLAILLIGYVYLIRKKGLDWE
jgi:NADH-quinone oxidoreductase subunit A